MKGQLVVVIEADAEVLSTILGNVISNLAEDHKHDEVDTFYWTLPGPPNWATDGRLHMDLPPLSPTKR